jgi:Na+-transporting methylmalonyl-CoA/oxaloacetate decarboxylase gamma subunit
MIRTAIFGFGLVVACLAALALAREIIGVIASRRRWRRMAEEVEAEAARREAHRRTRP